jgi:hypothetical protein
VEIDWATFLYGGGVLRVVCDRFDTGKPARISLYDLVTREEILPPAEGEVARVLASLRPGQS